MKGFGSVSVDYLEIPVRAANAFKKQGVMTVGDVELLSDEELLALRNFGRLTLEDTRGAVDRLRQKYYEMKPRLRSIIFKDISLNSTPEELKIIADYHGWTRHMTVIDGKPVIEDHPPGYQGEHVIDGKSWPVYNIAGKLRCRNPVCPVCQPIPGWPGRVASIRRR